MIPSPNGFTLPCAGPFHKINAGYVATTTTVNSSCLMYGYYFNAILLKHVIKASKNHSNIMDVGVHHANNRGNKEIPLAILSRILAQACVTPPYIIQPKGYA